MIYNKITDKPRWTDEDLFQSFRAQIDNSIERGWKREDIIIGTNFDFEYTWQLNNGNTAFIGTNVSHRSDTKAFFYDQCNEPGVPCTCEVIETYQPGDTNLVINSRTLVDIRAGVEFQDWTVQVYGQNIFDKYYWNWASAPVDTIWRYTGLPRTYGICLLYTSPRPRDLSTSRMPSSA